MASTQRFQQFTSGRPHSGYHLGNCNQRRWRTPIIAALAGITIVSATKQAAADPTLPNSLTHGLADPWTCATCHAFPNAEEKAKEPNYAPFYWMGSMMSNAARDPIFWAGVAIGHQDHPGETEDCVRCHSPRAFLEGRGSAIAMDELDEEDLMGITCDACHRMMDDGVTPPGNARYVIDDGVDGQPPAQRGPWKYEEDQAFMHEWILDDDFLASSRFCGTCHEVTTPRDRVDTDGNKTGTKFNEQRTYREWLNSAFSQRGRGTAKSCQDCHMPAVPDIAGCKAFSDAGLTHPTGGRRHDLAGANLFMLKLMREIYGNDGSNDVPDEAFDHTISRTEELLNTSATMEVEFPEQVDLQSGLRDLKVRVTNKTGHKLPTGYSEGRVMWIELQANYEDETLFVSGAWDKQSGLIDDPQIRRYEGIAEDSQNGDHFHLLRNDRWVVDNRIPPEGLKKDIETDPVGDRYTLQDDDTWPHWDEFSYAFDPLQIADKNGDEKDEIEIQVRLLYWINTPEYLKFLRDENKTNNAGQDVYDLFMDHGGNDPILLAEASQTVALVGFGDPDQETGDSDNSSDDDSSNSADTSSDDNDDDDDSSNTTNSGTNDDGSSSSSSSSPSSGCACSTSMTAPSNNLWMLGVWTLGLASALRRRKFSV